MCSIYAVAEQRDDQGQDETHLKPPRQRYRTIFRRFRQLPRRTLRRQTPLREFHQTLPKPSRGRSRNRRRRRSRTRILRAQRRRMMHHITAITSLKERRSRLRACVVVVWSERCRWGVREEGETRVVVGYDGTWRVIMIMVIMVILFWRRDWGSRMLGGTGGELEHFEGRSKARRR